MHSRECKAYNEKHKHVKAGYSCMCVKPRFSHPRLFRSAPEIWPTEKERENARVWIPEIRKILKRKEGK